MSFPERRPRAVRSVVVAVAPALVAVAFVGCGLIGPGPDPQPAFPDAGMEEDLQPIGPVVEIGRGQAMGRAWRFLVWESRIGSCTKIEFEDGEGPSGCGGTLGPGVGDGLVALRTYGGGSDGPWDFEGYADDEVVAVWIELGDGARLPATLMSLAPAGHDGQLFYASLPGDRGFSRVIGLDANGDEIGSQEIEGP